MKKKINRFYIISPFIYAFVICLFLVFHFTGRDSFKIEEIGYFSVSGKRAKNKFLSGRDILEIQAEFGPFNFFFSESNPIVLEADNEKKIKCSVESFLRYEKSAEIQFNKGINLAFQVFGDRGNSLIVKPEIIEKKFTGKMKSIVIPIKVTGRDTEYTNSLPVISSKNDYGFFFLSLPHGCEIYSAKGHLFLKIMHNEAIPNIVIEKINKNSLNPYLYWYRKNTPTHTNQKYQEAIKEFLDKAYNGWMNTRYLRDEKIWKTKTEKTIFNEEIALAFLSEALKKNEYKKVLPLIRSALNKDEDLLFKTTPYIGNIQKAVSIFSKRDVEEIKRVQNLLLEEDLSIFNIPNLILLLLDRGNISQIDELVTRIVRNLNYKDIDIFTCLGMIESYYSINRWIKTKVDYFESFKDLIGFKILPHLISTKRGVFLLNDLSPAEKLVDVHQSIRAGNILMRFGKQSDNEDLIYLGQKLILSSISLSDDEAFLPKEIVIQSFDKQDEYGILAPESIYEYITDQLYIPKEIPLNPEIKPGSWLWTVSYLKSYNKNAYESSFLLSFPAGETHYLFAQGISSFTSLYLYGKKTDPNPEYYNYPYGWFFDEKLRILYMKILHKNEDEQIILEY